MTKQIGSGMPQMGRAFGNWTTKISLVIRKQIVVDAVVIYQDIPTTFQGTVQPLNARQLMLKPEGQRSFTWLQIHVVATNIDLKPGDRIVFNGRNYKIDGLWPYELNNFVEYHAVEDFQDRAKC